MPSENTYVSLFSSGGLGCYGFKLEGFKCLATAELIERRMDVQKANGVCEDPAGYVLGDLTDPAVHARVIARVAQHRFNHAKSELTVVVATPPCQGMSVANHKKTKTEIVRNSLVIESIRLIKELKPRYFVLENVRSFMTAACVDLDGDSKTIGDAISSNLGALYNYSSRILNLKDYGSPSSRTRTLVIGVRKDIADVTPLDLFPPRSTPRTLRELIGDLEPLTEMGSTSAGDIFHGFKSYKPHMRNWISNLKPGECAFDNPISEFRPHRIVDGRRVENQRKNGDKYTRARWEAVPPCVHTRNDILSSQNTVHPDDDRVFSIRELMRFMGVPESFRWTSDSLEDLNGKSPTDRENYLRQNEANIRQCLGEGVPTPVFRKIAATLSRVELEGRSEIAAHFSEIELANVDRRKLSAFYTRQDIAFGLARELPDFKQRKITILEPSVGAGALLPAVLRRYSDKIIDLVITDIDEGALQRAVQVAREFGNPDITVRAVPGDFLDLRFDEKFDLVVGNPPFGKSTTALKGTIASAGSSNLFSLFLEKALVLAPYVSLIIPKSFTSAPEYWRQRTNISQRHVRCISDFGNRAFKDVKIETIGLHTGPAAPGDSLTLLDSLVLPVYRYVQQHYIMDPQLPTWVLYRNEFFDHILGSIAVGSFDVYRDRTISRKDLRSTGDYPVLRAKNIGHAEVVGGTESSYIDEESVPSSWKKIRNRTDLIAVPNLSYYPRGAFVPDGFVPDGSAAVLVPRAGATIDESSLQWFSSELFYYYYRIARNYSVRSLNVDRCSVFYFGLPFETDSLVSDTAARDASRLFDSPPASLMNHA